MPVSLAGQTMRPTDPLPPRSERPTDDLLEELCIALRDVGMSTRFLPYREPDPDIDDEVERVRAIDDELRRRGAEPTGRLKTLSDETGWSMLELMQEVRRYPAVRPWVREKKDGLRIATRCQACGLREFPVDSRTV